MHRRGKVPAKSVHASMSTGVAGVRVRLPLRASALHDGGGRAAGAAAATPTSLGGRSRAAGQRNDTAAGNARGERYFILHQVWHDATSLYAALPCASSDHNTAPQGCSPRDSAASQPWPAQAAISRVQPGQRCLTHGCRLRRSWTCRRASTRRCPAGRTSGCWRLTRSCGCSPADRALSSMRHALGRALSSHLVKMCAIPYLRVHNKDCLNTELPCSSCAGLMLDTTYLLTHSQCGVSCIPRWLRQWVSSMAKIVVSPTDNNGPVSPSTVTSARRYERCWCWSCARAASAASCPATARRQTCRTAASRSAAMCAPPAGRRPPSCSAARPQVRRKWS